SRWLKSSIYFTKSVYLSRNFFETILTIREPRRQHVKFRSVLSAIPLLLSLNAGASEKDESIWLLVETVPHVVKVMAGDRDLEVFEEIAIGRHGAGLFKERGDYKTPLGEY